MIPGPVFHSELLTTARRGRYYLLRSAYALTLLLILWAIYSVWLAETGVSLSTNQAGWFALSAFGGLAVGQMILVLTLTPALVSGVIADEKRRKTLHYLLASRLTGPEIVIGKLLARMLHVGVLLGVSLPVLSMLVLFGGVDPLLILLACGAAASTAWFLAALSIWVSTIARRAREALFISYGIEFLWLFLPVMVRYSPSVGWPIADQVLGTAMDWMAASSPVEVGREKIFFGALSGPISLAASLVQMIQLQAIAGAILTALAAWQVRPVFRAQEGAGSTRRGLLGALTRRRSGRIWSRPALGDRPMLWKELFTSRARGFVRLIAVLLTLTAGGCLLYWTIWLGSMAFLEMWERGYAPEGFRWQFALDRMRFAWFLQAVIPLIYVAGILSVAGAAASSITSEHEDDTWTSLTATDLTGREIVLAKMLGALWRPRAIVVSIFLLAAFGVITGAIHPLSFPILALSLVVYGWFAVALGTWISLQLRSTWRAQFLTISGLLLVNISGQALLSNLDRWAPLLWPGFTPYEISKTLLDMNFRQQWAVPGRWWGRVFTGVEYGPRWLILFGILSLVAYLASAVILTCLALRRFEAVAGRARPSRLPQPAKKQALADLDPFPSRSLPSGEPV
jgi:ABC-type transport system involved in multi-copper enzyme maturation permease subunit